VRTKKEHLKSDDAALGIWEGVTWGKKEGISGGGAYKHQKGCRNLSTTKGLKRREEALEISWSSQQRFPTSNGRILFLEEEERT